MIGVPTPHFPSDQLVAEAVWQQSRALPNLDLLPPRAHDEVQHLMRHAIASVNTADHEGMPNVLLEAWSRGVPALVLTHDPGGVVERHHLGAFAHGSTARFVELANEQWRTRNDRERVSERCRAYIGAHHAPEVIASQWADVICRTSMQCQETAEGDRLRAA
jgi:glycosyltransferase involved in cell wall biosynthesis